MARKKKRTAKRSSPQTFAIDGTFADVDLLDECPEDQGRGLVEESMNVARSNCQCEDYEDFAGSRLMIPESRWRDLAAAREQQIRDLVYRIMNQGREGACVGFGMTQAMQIRMSMQFGKANAPDLSGISLYNLIGRSAQSGAMMSDGAREVSIDNADADGVLPLDTPANRAKFKHVYRARGFVGERGMDREVPDRLETSKLFRAKILRINTVDAWVSANLRFQPIMYGRDGHAICGLLPKFNGNDLWFGYVNSWGAWGDIVNAKVGRGMGWDSRRKIQRCTGYAVVWVRTRDDLAISA